MKELALKVFGSIIRSILVSAIMFVVGFSLITGEFPPDFNRIPRMMDQVQKLTQVSREVHEKQKLLKSKMKAQGFIEDQDVEALQELQLKRAEIGASIGSGKELKNQNSMNSSESQEEVAQLRIRVSVLETKLLKLQNHVDRLEDQINPPSSLSK